VKSGGATKDPVARYAVKALSTYTVHIILIQPSGVI